MSDYDFALSDLTKERNLWEIYLKVRLIRPSNLQAGIVFICILGLFFQAYFIQSDSDALVKSIRAWSEIGFGFCLATLGFLIAGFTIFATLSKPEMMLKMMEFNDEETQLPILKKNLFSFIKVFINYLFFAFLYGAVIVFGGENGLAVNLNYYFPDPELSASILSFIIYICVGIGFPYLILMLKAYVYNMYAVVMMALRWEAQVDDEVVASKPLVAVLYELMMTGYETESVMSLSEAGLSNQGMYSSKNEVVRLRDVEVLKQSFIEASRLISDADNNDA
jgi:hypothetical protein